MVSCDKDTESSFSEDDFDYFVRGMCIILDLTGLKENVKT